MRDRRLSFALARGLDLPPLGDIDVHGDAFPRDLEPLPRTRLRIIARFAPSAEACRAAGLSVVDGPSGRAEAALVILPRARDAQRAMLAEAAAGLRPGGLLMADGAKTDGVDATLRELTARGLDLCSVSKAHGRVFWTRPGSALSGDLPKPQPVGDGLVTLPGVFSADGPDPASVLLALSLPDTLGPHVVDLGAGWGFLSDAVLRSDRVKRLTLIEADRVALRCAELALRSDPRARYVWADATTVTLDARADDIVCNPPFHVGRKADPALGAAFIATAARLLHPAGRLWLVANRHLPYDPVLDAHFAERAEIAGTPAFRVLRAARPKTRTGRIG